MSHKNLNAKIKIPKKLKEILSQNKISQIYKRFEKNLAGLVSASVFITANG